MSKVTSAPVAEREITITLTERSHAYLHPETLLKAGDTLKVRRVTRTELTEL